MEDRRQEGPLCPHCGSSNVIFRQRQCSWLCISCDEEFSTVAPAAPHTPSAAPYGQFTMPYTPPVSPYTPSIQPVPAAEKSATRPIRVFISFGRPDRDICRRICQELKTRGFDPWFDEERLNPSADWREKTVEGMRDSDAAVICFSRFSVTESYVCKKELQLALQYLESNILTVKMEPDAVPPDQLRRIQWLDMSEYKERQNRDAKTPEVFDCWFQLKMDELCGMLNSREGREAARELKLIRERLGVRVSTGKQDNLLENGLVGRAWMFDRVDQWLEDPTGKPLCVLYGDPGVGKSAFAAHYLRDKAEKAIAGVLFMVI